MAGCLLSIYPNRLKSCIFTVGTIGCGGLIYVDRGRMGGQAGGRAAGGGRADRRPDGRARGRAGGWSEMHLKVWGVGGPQPR